MDLPTKRLFLRDLDGTLHPEETLLPGAAEFLAEVRQTGGVYRFSTNNSSRGVEVTVDYLKKNRSPADVYYAVGTASFCRAAPPGGLYPAGWAGGGRNGGLVIFKILIQRRRQTHETHETTRACKF